MPSTERVKRHPPQAYRIPQRREGAPSAHANIRGLGDLDVGHLRVR
jgi:hypothetical protein